MSSNEGGAFGKSQWQVLSYYIEGLTDLMMKDEVMTGAL